MAPACNWLKVRSPLQQQTQPRTRCLPGRGQKDATSDASGNGGSGESAGARARACLVALQRSLCIRSGQPIMFNLLEMDANTYSADHGMPILRQRQDHS